MNADQNVRTNLPDVLALYIKALVAMQTTPEKRVQRNPAEVIRKAQHADLKLAVGLDGCTTMELVEGQDPRNTKIILPSGNSPLTIL